MRYPNNMMVSIKVCQKATSWHITWKSTGNLNVLKCHKYSFCLITVEYFSRTRRRAAYQYIKKEGCSTQSPVQRFFFIITVECIERLQIQQTHVLNIKSTHWFAKKKKQFCSSILPQDRLR